MPSVPPRVAFLTMVGALWSAIAALSAATEPQGIRGVVTLPDGQPAAGADVWLIDTAWLSSPVDGETSRSRIQESAKTNVAGQFSFNSEPPNEDYRGHLAVLARDPMGRLGWVTSYAHPNWGDLRLALAEVDACVGRVLNEAGQPLAGVEVTAASLDASKFEREYSSEFVMLPSELAKDYRATSAADGGFSIPRLPRGGSLAARFTRSGDAPIRADWNLGDSIELRLARPGALAIRLTAEDAEAGANRTVYVRRAAQPRSAYRLHYSLETKTDAAGQLRLEGLPPGEFAVNVGDDDYGPRWYAKSEVAARVAAGQTTDLAVPLEPGVAVAGAVVDAETKRGLPHVQVRIANLVEQAIRVHAQLMTDAEGRYAGFVKPGQIYVTVQQTTDDYSLPPQATKAETGEQRSVELPPIALARSIPVEGVVRDASGKPVAGALVYVTAAPPFGDRLVREFLTADENGRFRVTGLPADDGFTLHAYTETAVSDGGWLVVPNKQQGDVELQVKPELGFRLRGRVVNEQGQPMADVPVRVMWLRGYFSRHSEMSGISSPLPPVITDADGGFESRLLWPQDRYTARIFVPGHQITEVPGGRSDQQWVGSPPETLNVPDIVLKKQQ